MREADILITNGIVITMNPQNDQFQHGAIAVVGDTITAVGDSEQLSDVKANRTIDAHGGIILPGLINTHTHAAMTCFRGLADDLPLMTWLNDYIFPAESKLNPNKVYTGSLLACAEMILSGTTCFCDMYLFEDEVAKAANEAGIRAVVGEVLFDFPSPNYGSIENGFSYTEQLIEKWKSHPLITIAVEPHSPYLCSPEILQRSSSIAQKHQIPIVIHVSETRSEVNVMMERYGRTPVEHLASIGVLTPNLVACHCVVLSENDIALLKKHQVKVAHNPESNMKLASGIAPIPELLKAEVCVGLGTDGCASNNNLDMFQEMDTASKLHKVNTLDPTVMDALTTLKMSTIHAATALGLDNKIGSLEVGKKADIIVIDTRKPHLTPMYHPVSHLVYSANGSDVVLTMINGKIIMENRQILSFDVEDVMKRINSLMSHAS